MTLNQIVGCNVRVLRLARSITQAELARLVGLSRTSITNLEAGSQNITISGLADIAYVLECPPPMLLIENQAQQELAAIQEAYDESIIKWRQRWRLSENETGAQDG